MTQNSGRQRPLMNKGLRLDDVPVIPLLRLVPQPESLGE